MSVNLNDLYDYALTFFGLPYVWGGEFEERTLYGGDCSALAKKILKRGGKCPAGDFTSHDLYRYALKNDWIKYQGLGAFAFFGTEARVSHVGFMLDKRLMISAAGGGANCTTVQIARNLKAAVRIDPVSYWKAPALITTLTPFV